MVQWDRQKADANRLKHGIELADVVVALVDEFAITRGDDDADEERFVAIGMDGLGRVVVVSYAWRGDDVRLISARRATPRERRLYEGRRR
ncbi:MAG: BrnT family toxin [Myxococcota bacterium]